MVVLHRGKNRLILTKLEVQDTIYLVALNGGGKYAEDYLHRRARTTDGR